jgi:hypothetical protein
MALIESYSAFLTSLQSAKFEALWPAQRHILDQYGTFEGKSDVGIELPTGAGKTLIALLVAEAWRRAGKTAAILSANKTLARQMDAEARALGIPSVLMQGKGSDIPGSDKRAYQRSNAIAIMNYWVYFNQRPVIDPASLLIMDDAHLAEHALNSLFSVEIDRFKHEVLFRTLVSELSERFPEYSVLADALVPNPPKDSTPELLSFIDQDAIADRLREIVGVSGALASDMDLSFRWGRLRNLLRESNIYISSTKIWIRPYIFPLLGIEHYSDVKQCLYVSATIGDPADLSRRLGVRQITKIPVDAAYSERTSGRRFIVTTRVPDESEPVHANVQAALARAVEIHPKSVWLCASASERDKYQTAFADWLNKKGLINHRIWTLSPLGDELEQFKAAPEGHLFVSGRYDGMDFKADECRLVVVTSLPRAINIQEEFISKYLRDSGFMRHRLNQRIVQSLGRCNRGDSDFGVYILADRRFATHFGRDSNRVGIPSDMIAEIDMAQDTAEMAPEDLTARVDAFMKQQFEDYDHALAKYKLDLPKPRSESPLSDTSEAEVLGWKALMSQNYDLAAARFEAVWKEAEKAHLREIGAFHKWNWAKAVYLQSLLGEVNAKSKSLVLLDEAVTRGGVSSWFNRMRASLNRARAASANGAALPIEYQAYLFRAFDDQLEGLGTKGNRFERFCKKVSDGLGSESHNEFNEALETLGTVLGFDADRPKYQAATDNRWRGTFGNDKELFAFEVKVEHEDGNEITAYHVGQAHNQRLRAEHEFKALGYSVRGAIITHLTAINATAKSSAGPVRIIEKNAVMSLWERIRVMLSLYRDKWSLDDIPARLVAVEAVRALSPPTGWLLRALDADTLFIGADLLLKEWS